MHNGLTHLFRYLPLTHYTCLTVFVSCLISTKLTARKMAWNLYQPMLLSIFLLFQNILTCVTFSKVAYMLCLPFQRMSCLHSKGKVVDKEHFFHQVKLDWSFPQLFHSPLPVSILQHISVLIWPQAFPLQKAANLSWILLKGWCITALCCPLATIISRAVAEEKQEMVLLAHILMRRPFSKWMTHSGFIYFVNFSPQFTSSHTFMSNFV